MSKKDERPVIVLKVDLDPMTLEQWADKTNQTVRAVAKQADDGNIPIIQKVKGGKRYINRAKMVLASLEAADWDVRVPHDMYSL
ncbi:hypothetical protein IHC92_17465 [Photobacterium damselae subsp. damselae]|uniref:hypothetical protein n=1 Tax=Photobacterium damselae TaxID=38293 RepID=UPI001F40730E|nr:hypothetical protein [Photobacterium damselae]UJZ96366.1 hypothetical protein IHC87_17515 [Photobacterium damselae subsp. damselae]UJZ99729.1 hypothetical protein IHC88_19975 [Photobacterium damselae subsp. damselae]UKA08846.1 hypothetical protein IHC90_17730 [Photobacterium damselae subsp. damselae]UKA08848.1 hypothetical protein IHC90_17740 [Photobacterium damselae subsp. damselae]UKA12699.1 hypothetical protein IHC91_17485 [Photobacterium damselae subsp. damselae]